MEHAPLPLYQRLLANEWDHLPRTLQRFHGLVQPITGRGVFRVRNSEKVYGKFLARILRLPMTGEAVPVQLDVTSRAGGEYWKRRFGPRFFITKQWAQEGKLLAEKVSLLEFWFRLTVKDHRLFFHQEKVMFRMGSFVFPLPRSLAPVVTARCWSDTSQANMRVAVQVTIPMIGNLLSYEGYMEECNP